MTLAQLLSVPGRRAATSTRLSQVATPVAYLAFTTLDEPLTDLRARLTGGGGQRRPASPAALHTAGHALVAGPEWRTGRPADPRRLRPRGPDRWPAVHHGQGGARTTLTTKGAPAMYDAFHVPLWLWGVALAVVLAVAVSGCAARLAQPWPGARAARGGAVHGRGRRAGRAVRPGPGGGGRAAGLGPVLRGLADRVQPVAGQPVRLRPADRPLRGGTPAAQPGPAGRDRLRPAAAGRVHRGGRRRPEPLRLGALHLRRGAAGHRGPDGRGPRRPAGPGGGPARIPGPRCSGPGWRAA